LGRLIINGHHSERSRGTHPESLKETSSGSLTSLRITALKIRKAIESEVQQLLPLMRQLAEFEKYADAFVITEDILCEQGFR